MPAFPCFNPHRERIAAARQQIKKIIRDDTQSAVQKHLAAVRLNEWKLDDLHMLLAALKAGEAGAACEEEARRGQ